MSTTGTPIINNYTSRIVTEKVTPLDIWVDALECLRLDLVKKIFPNITLRELSEQYWSSCGEETYPLSSMAIKPYVIGDAKYYNEQGLYYLDQKFSIYEKFPFPRKFWGLARNGIWVAGFVIYQPLVQGHQTIPGRAETVIICSTTLCRDIIESHVAPEIIASFLGKSVYELIIDKHHRLAELDSNFSYLKLFADIAELKMQQKSQ